MFYLTTHSTHFILRLYDVRRISRAQFVIYQSRWHIFQYDAKGH